MDQPTAYDRARSTLNPVHRCLTIVDKFRYVTPMGAHGFLTDWCRRALHSRIEPIKKVAKTLRNHHDLILNWFRAEGQISSGIVEGFNNKVKLTTRKAYGFRSFETIEIALYHALGDLPEPDSTHRFC